jgi:hypothetical protein
MLGAMHWFELFSSLDTISRVLHSVQDLTLRSEIAQADPGSPASRNVSAVIFSRTSFPNLQFWTLEDYSSCGLSLPSYYPKLPEPTDVPRLIDQR